MTTYVLNILLAALAVSMFVSNSDGFVLNGHQVKMTDSDSSKDTVIEDLKTHHPTVRHFARHGLCSNYEGKRTLYIAMKAKVCDISLSTIQSVVLDLCRHKNHMLDKWVEELFDIDGNGYISHFEKHLYS
ncbi:uncharacterized protein LOC132726248 [Ruditapes philippinarum]|uniref:uncharacterized protein LOC132726248 n=1 Tax=Ruditapes philippinarum TaxID=129788 RepID=UPI00295BBE04|nr:uncharacterized protein LOC132726248 [Ruditapes philippinarum]XP_060567511.1 uncharacterized protein LOC132726248 [Ruditapes philippinarum]